MITSSYARRYAGDIEADMMVIPGKKINALSGFF